MQGMEQDQILWGKFKHGNSDAFYEIYDLHYTSLFYYANRICSDEELARDCIHDLFLELWESREKITFVTSIKPYLFKFLRNIIIDKINKKKKLVNAIETSFTENLGINITLSQEDLIIKNDETSYNIQHLTEAFNILSSRQKEIVYLRFYNNLNYEEIADITNLKYQSVRNLVSKALQKLREVLGTLAFVIFFLS
ncbi:MAG: hypothetical protein CMO01_12190 [Thalassobius sp.]|nr:hypothetical protein [Thalassovita sp.]